CTHRCVLSASVCSALAASSSSYFALLPPPPCSCTLFPYTTLFRSCIGQGEYLMEGTDLNTLLLQAPAVACSDPEALITGVQRQRSEEHTSELQSRFEHVCRHLREKKKTQQHTDPRHKSQCMTHEQT